MRGSLLLSMIGVMVLAPGARAASFTFADPPGAGDLSYAAGRGATPGHISYLFTPINLVLDFTSEGGSRTDNLATLLMDISVGTAVAQPGGGFIASISGHFEFTAVQVRGGSDSLLRGDFANGHLVTSLASGALITTSQLSLVYSLGGVPMPGVADAAFTLTDILPGLGLNQDGYLNDFSANAAYTGTLTTAAIPLPSAFALGGAAMVGLATMSRRRRT